MQVSAVSVKLIEGDLLDHDAKYIVHQCNCISKTWSGLAYGIFQKYPYSNIYQERKIGKFIHKPGEIYTRGDGNGKRYVINATAQIYPGKPNGHGFLNFNDAAKDRKQFFYDCLMAIADIKDLNSVAFPYKIGCGLAGGDWNFYSKTIDKFATYVEKKDDVQVFIIKRPGDQ